MRRGFLHAEHLAQLITFHHFDVEQASRDAFEVIAILAEDATRGGVNKEEALAITSLMAAAWEQPEYDGATFGVGSSGPWSRELARRRPRPGGVWPARPARAHAGGRQPPRPRRG